MQCFRPTNSPPLFAKNLTVTAAKHKVRLSGVYYQNGNGSRPVFFGVKDSLGNQVVAVAGHETPASGNGPNAFGPWDFPRIDAGVFTIGEVIRCYLEPAPWEGDFNFDTISLLLELVD